MLLQPVKIISCLSACPLRLSTCPVWCVTILAITRVRKAPQVNHSTQSYRAEKGILIAVFVLRAYLFVQILCQHVRDQLAA